MPATEAQMTSIVQSLRAREIFKFLKTLLLFFFGLPVLFFGPLIAIGLYINIAYRWGYSVEDWEFYSALCILVPLMFWIERRTAGPSFTDTIIKGWTIRNPPSNFRIFLGEWIAQANTLGTIEIRARSIAEISLWGPRQIREGISDLRTIVSLRAVNRRRATRVLADLSRGDQGPEIETLILPGESLQSLLRVMAFLLFYDWIGVAKDGKRVWITSDSNAALKIS